MRNSFRIAYGGIIAALGLIAMLLSGIFPFAEYTLPAVAGIILVAMVVEFDYKSACIAYVVISLLSLLIAANKEAVALFICFFGYYPIIKGKIEVLEKKWLQWLIKLLIFNAAVIFAYYVLITLFSMTELLDDFAFVQYGLWIIWAVGNAVFVLYDIAVTRVITFYLYKIHPKYVDRLQ